MAQLAEASGLGPEGWGFDSLQRHHMRLPYNGYYKALPTLRCEFDSHYPLHDEKHMNLSDIQSLQCEITSYCNARCPQCPRFDQYGNLYPGLTLSHWNHQDILSNIELDQLTNLKLVRLEGDKGDPVMHPNCDEIVNFFVNAPSRPLVRLVTNGSIQTQNWWSKMGELSKQNNFDVIFSIDGLADTNQIYRINTDFKKIMRNAQAFIDAGGQAIWKFLVFKHNEHQLNEITELAKAMGFAAIQVRKADDYRFLGNSSFVVYDQGNPVGEIKPSDIPRDQLLYFTWFDKKKEFIERFIVDKNCVWMNQGKMNITFQGYLMPCCMMHHVLNDVNQDLVQQTVDLIKNPDDLLLTKHTVQDILNSEFYKHRLETHLQGKTLHPICESNCKKQIEDKLIATD